MALAPRVLRAIAYKLYAKGKNVKDFFKSPVGQMATRAGKRASEHKYIKGPFTKGSTMSSARAEEVGHFLKHLLGKSHVNVTKGLKKVEKYSQKGHPEVAIPLDALKHISKVVHDTTLGAGRQGLKTIADSAAGKIAIGTHSVVDAFLHNTGRKYLKAVNKSSVRNLQKKGLKTGLGKVKLSNITEVRPQLPTTGIGIGNKLRRFIVDKYTNKMTKNRKYLAHALGKDALKPEISDAVIRAKHTEFKGALKTLRNHPSLVVEAKAMKDAEKVFNDQITKTTKVILPDKLDAFRKSVKTLEKEVSESKDSKMLPKLKQQLKKAKTQLAENEILHEKRTEFNTAKAKWLDEAEKKAKDEFGKYDEAKKGVIEAKRNKLMGGTNIKLGPPLVLAGTAAYGGVKGTKVLYKTLKTEHERQKLKEKGTLKLKALKEIYRNNHPGMTEDAIDRMAKQTLYAHDLNTAQSDIARTMLNTYQHLDRLGGIIPPEVKEKKITTSKKPTKSLLSKLKGSKLFGGKKKKK